MKFQIPENLSLKMGVNGLEDAIIVISGPALAVSGIIAGVDLLTGGHVLQQVQWLALAWAICLLLTLDFQVLSLGARAHQVYLSEKPGGRKALEIILAFAIAAAVSFVSIQMQSIIARMNGSGLTIDQAAAQLGVNLIALIWERSALVLVLIFMSGWFREEKHDRGEQAANSTNTPVIPANVPTSSATDEAIKKLAEQMALLAVSVTQITTTVTEVKTTVTAIVEDDRREQKALPERTEANAQLTIVDSIASEGEHESFVANAGGEQKAFAANSESEQGEQDTNIEQRIRNLLADNSGLSDHKIASIVGCSSSTANKWRRRIEEQSAA